MELTLHRKYKKQGYTIGNLYIDRDYFCDTLEDTDRGIKQTDDISHIKAVKIPKKTAIPTGIYNITMDVTSPKFNQRVFYREVCKGKVPRILNVPCFSGILIHAGVTADNTEGCILVGKNRERGKLLESMATFTELYKRLQNARNNGEEIIINIY